MQKHLHSFYNQASLYKQSLDSLPTSRFFCLFLYNLALPELPYSIHLAYHQHNQSLQDILSGDETDNAANPSFSQDSTVFLLSINSLLLRVIISLILLMMKCIIILIMVHILVVMNHLMVH